MVGAGPGSVEDHAARSGVTRLADDVARLRRVLTRQNGPTLLAGHTRPVRLLEAYWA